MGRKSIAGIRKEEILDAFEVCIGKYGFANSTTRRIAEEASINQPMISHYFGSKESMVKALVIRIVSQYLVRLDEAVGDSEGQIRIEQILNFLFGPGLLGSDAKGNLIGQLISASVNDKELKTQVRNMYQSFIAKGENEMKALFPNAGTGKVKSCVYGVLCLAVGNDALISTDIPYSNRELARRCAEVFVDTLK